MGYDMTFHGVHADLEGRLMRRFLDGELAARAIIAELPHCDDDLPDVVEDALEQLFDPELRAHEYFATWMAYRLCMISAYYRPCWYCRGHAGISFWCEKYPELKAYIEPVTLWVGGSVAGIADPTAGILPENYAASGIVTDPRGLLACYEDIYTEAIMGGEMDWAFRSALRHCIDHGLCYVEASDVYSPMAGAVINVKHSVHAQHLPPPVL